jgi:HEAT repeat protein
MERSLGGLGWAVGSLLWRSIRTFRASRALRSGTLEVRRLAARQLFFEPPPLGVGWLHSCTARALIGALSDKDLGNRPLLLIALGRVADARVVPALTEALRDDPDTECRAMAAGSLGQQVDSAVVPALVESLGADPAERVRSICARALGNCGDASVLPALRDALHHDPNTTVRAEALQALRSLEAPDILALASERLTKGERFERVVAAALIRGRRDAEAIPILRAALPAEADKSLRRQMASALAEVGEAGIEALVALLRGSADDARLRLSICLGLGHGESAAAAEQLGELLDDPDRYVRQAAPWAALRIAGPGRSEVVQSALQHPFPGVRREALRALAVRGTSADIVAVEAMAGDASPSVRRAAEYAAREIRAYERLAACGARVRGS